VTDSSNKIRAARIALQDVDPAKGPSKEEIRASLAADGFGRNEVASLFAEVFAEAETLAAKKALLAARAKRREAARTNHMLEVVRGLALPDDVLKAKIERFERMGAQIAHRELTDLTREDLESQYADLLIAAGIDPNDEGSNT